MKKKEITFNIHQLNEFNLNARGYYCKVRTVWDSVRKKNSFKFDIVMYEDDKEILIQAGKKVFQCGEIEAIKERDKIISYYLNKVKNEQNN